MYCSFQEPHVPLLIIISKYTIFKFFQLKLIHVEILQESLSSLDYSLYIPPNVFELLVRDFCRAAMCITISKQSETFNVIPNLLVFGFWIDLKYFLKPTFCFQFRYLMNLSYSDVNASTHSLKTVLKFS